jgi:hypothetical protein
MGRTVPVSCLSDERSAAQERKRVERKTNGVPRHVNLDPVRFVESYGWIPPFSFRGTPCSSHAFVGPVGSNPLLPPRQLYSVCRLSCCCLCQCPCLCLTRNPVLFCLEPPALPQRTQEGCTCNPLLWLLPSRLRKHSRAPRELRHYSTMLFIPPETRLHLPGC